MTKKKAKTSSAATAVKQVLNTIVQITDEFCHEHLNAEYAELTRKLAEKLSRKRPSPLLRGKPETWACGIIRSIGWVNFLDDSSFEPYLKFTVIDKALDVASSTGQRKAKEIRDLLKMYQLDPKWSLPSRLDDNPMVWMLEVDGFILDFRDVPRELQEVAFEKGLIPYIPADRDPDVVKSGNESKPEQESGRLYQFKITLSHSQPAIWRRIQVPDGTLDQLHEHIQAAMGWTNSHLHQFDIGGQRCGDPELLCDGFMDDAELVNSLVTNISEVVPKDGKRFRFRYEYDFGDGWEHEVLFEGCPPVDSRQTYPRCVEGDRACPPEDVGGVWGFMDFLKAVTDPDHERHEEFLEWVGGSFDPVDFDADEASQRMRRGLPAWR